MSQERNTQPWFRIPPGAGIGATLARVRQSVRMTQAELAARLDVDRTTIVRMEKTDVAALDRIVKSFAVFGYELVAVPKGATITIESEPTP